jgi:uncharacterized protein YjiS (DUF1127 family)
MRENLGSWWRAVRDLLGLWRRRMRECDELSRMTDAELRDARITRYEAWLEIRKPFWRA